MRSVYFVVEAGNRVGMGHYNRVLSLYNEAILRHLNVSLLIISSDVRDYFADQVFNTYDELISSDYINSNSIVLIDGYSFDFVENAALFEKSHKTVIIDDFFRQTPKDVIMINPSLTNNSDKYKNRMVYSGPDYVLIRNEFVEINPIMSTAGNVILVYLGGAATIELLNKVLISIDNSFKGFLIKIVTLSSVEHSKITHLEHNSIELLGVLSGIDFLREIKASKLGIIAAGQIIYEFIIMKKPFFPILTVENQIENIKSLKSVFPKLIHSYSDDSHIEINRKVKSLTSDYLMELNHQFENLIDGRGVKRVVDVIVGCLENE
jgi:spore coat polysaccharide biosynthesis predicted glycosyltransferase SpsG